MRSLQSPGRRRGPGRAGFTLMELVVVVAIIGVLLSLTAAGVFAVIGSQRVSNTKTTLNKLAPIVKAQWNSVAEKAFRDWASNQPIARQYQSSVQTIAGNDPGRQSVVYVKLKLGQIFPMSFDEVLNPSSNMLPGLTVYQKKLKALGITASSSTTGPYESSALLLMALQEGISGQKITVEDLGSSAVASFPAGSGTIPALVDGWSSPIAFFRWPTGSPDLNPSPGAGPVTNTYPPPPTPHFSVVNYPQLGTNRDLTDPQGYLTSAKFLGAKYPSGNVTSFQKAIGYWPPPRVSDGPQSYTLVPLLVSPGPDTALGMANPAVTTGIDPNATPDSNGGANDNISSAAQ